MFHWRAQSLSMIGIQCKRFDIQRLIEVISVLCEIEFDENVRTTNSSKKVQEITEMTIY